MSTVANAMASEVTQVKVKRMAAAFAVALVALVLFALSLSSLTLVPWVRSLTRSGISWKAGCRVRSVVLSPCIMIVVGITFGVRQQNIMAFVMGPAAGIGLFYSPTIITSLMGAGVVVS